eukprot:1258739-Pleurochrysis_carterae.AAC.1
MYGILLSKVVIRRARETSCDDNAGASRACVRGTYKGRCMNTAAHRPTAQLASGSVKSIVVLYCCSPLTSSKVLILFSCVSPTSVCSLAREAT